MAGASEAMVEDENEFRASVTYLKELPEEAKKVTGAKWCEER